MKHSVFVGRDKHPVWEWNGSFDAPTFTPSILVTGERGKVPFACHSFVEGGNIRFLNDCTHSLAGQTVPLPEVDG